MTASEVFLYVIVLRWGALHWNRIEMPDMNTCIKAVSTSQGYVSPGAENEAGAVLFCAGPDFDRTDAKGNWVRRGLSESGTSG